MSFNLIKALLPPKTDGYDDSVNARMLIFCCLVALLGGAYGFFKWLKLGHDFVPWTSLTLACMSVVMLFFHKRHIITTEFVGHIMAGAVAIYMTSLVYGLGGIASNHTFWMLAAIVYAF